MLMELQDASMAYTTSLRQMDQLSEPAGWSPDSWRSRPITQDIIYPDLAELNQVCEQIRSMPPLVLPARIEYAREMLAEAANGNAFVIQGGDCAENFDDVCYDIVHTKRALLAKQQQILQARLGKPILEIGRIAGQYAKPRSMASETLSCGTVVGTFRGHNVNSFHPKDRLPDPRRLLIGHHLAAVTREYLKILEKKDVLSMSLESRSERSACNNFFTSHEALNLPLESALTRNQYNTSAEFLWIGERSRAIDGAHIEYIRGLRNPFGVKIGPTTEAAELVKVLNFLCPDRTIGRITLITRLGFLGVERCLPKLIEAVKASGHRPLWMCDPCHGNTITTSTGIKTRVVESIVAEIKKTFVVHQACGTYLGGLHLEQSGEDVTECIDSMNSIDIGFPRYRTLCDPRLSPRQAIHVIEEFTSFVQEYRSAGHTGLVYSSSSSDPYLELGILRLSEQVAALNALNAEQAQLIRQPVA
ncbi:hypothetical protein MMC27_008452 [Xylographa pallens]|nr:hypothetical protein [Xylographa pallens]